MTMRPPLPGAAHQQVARSRMAPGGQVKPFSQSPIPRAGGVRRVRQAGVAPPLAVEYLGYEYVSTGDNFGDATLDLSQYFADWWDPLLFVEGGTAILVVAQHERTLTAPSGWTTLASGTEGDLGYLIAAQSNVGINDTVEVGVSAGGVTFGACWLLSFTDVPAGYAPAVSSVTEVAAATEQDFITPDSGWLSPVSVLLTLGTALHVIRSDELTDGVDFEYAQELETGFPPAAPEVASVLTVPGTVIPSGADAQAEDATTNDPVSVIWVACALGFST